VSLSGSSAPAAEVARRRGSGRWAVVDGVAVDTEHDCVVCGVDGLNRVKGKSASALPEHASPADDDLVRVVAVSLVADVIDLAGLPAVACEHEVARSRGEQAAQFGLSPQTSRAALLHRKGEGSG
jgi:hypothetical protein